MLSEIVSIVSFLIALVALSLSVYTLYKIQTGLASLRAKSEYQDRRFLRLIEAINKVNYSEYTLDVKQEEEIKSLKAATRPF